MDNHIRVILLSESYISYYPMRSHSPQEVEPRKQDLQLLDLYLEPHKHGFLEGYRATYATQYESCLMLIA